MELVEAHNFFFIRLHCVYPESCYSSVVEEMYACFYYSPEHTYILRTVKPLFAYKHSKLRLHNYFAWRPLLVL